MNSRSISKAYGEFYYSHNCGRPYQRDEEWLNFFGSVADRIVRDIGPGTVLDAGCAMGFLVEALRARGVDAVGVDLSEYAIEQAHADVRPYCRVGSITEALPQRYDLIVCIEVIEHLSPLEADQAIENFCKHADDILISSTPFDYDEVTHLNVRPPDYWAQRFAQHGFFRDVDFDASFITPWSVRFRKTHEPAWRIVYGYERHLWQLEKEVQARRQLTVEQQEQLAQATQQVQSLTEKSAENERTVQTLSAEIAEHRETIESLTATLKSEQERSRRLLDEEAERLRTINQLSAQLAERDEKIDSLIAPVLARQSSLEASMARLLENEKTIAALIAQVESKEQSVEALRAESAALNAQMASKEQLVESLRAEVEDRREREQKLESQAAAARTTIETLTALKEENERAIVALSAELADKDHDIRAYKSREKGAELTIAALSQQRSEQEEALVRQRAEHEQALERQQMEHEQTLERLSVLLAEKETQLADVNSSMAWYLYNRLKYPYLIALFRLYERFKKRYLLAVYRRLGLAGAQTPTQLVEAGVAVPPPPETKDSVPPQTTFPVMEPALPPALTPHGASVDVIVCVHNALEDVKRCLESVVCHTRMPYTLILVDDGSDDETRAYLESFAGSQGALLTLNEKAKGYTFAANQALRRSRGQYVVLLNSDTVVTPLWLDRMIACGESDPHIGLVGPLSNVASWQSIPEISRNGDWAENKLPEGFAVADVGKLVGQYSARVYPRIPFLNGFCLMIKRGVIEQVGYFDEEVFGKGYGEENDYCLRARKAGWQLGIADDAYVYHAQSRSYSHERRKELSRHADEALATKHEPQMICDGVARCQTDRVLEGVRARSRVMFERKRLVEEGISLWEGKRVVFILTIRSACGGGNVIFDEAEAMRRMGVDARVLNLSRNQAEFERSYPERNVPAMYVEDESLIPELTADSDALIASAFDTVYWLKPAPGGGRQPIRAYYIQDFEPYFFSPELPGFRIAWNSYTEHPDQVRLTKTEWNREEVWKNTGMECSVVGHSVNIDLYRPRTRRESDWPVRPLRVAAMIRPSTPRRNPKLTMDVLREFYQAHGETVEIILFGCESSDPEFLALAQGFAWRNAGMLTRPQVASLLNEVDIFVDFSEYQAMGLTAMEAMACGVAVIVPQKGGAGSFAAHERNALIVDTSSREACLETLRRLTIDQELRTRLQRRAIVDVCQYYPERAAYNMLGALFPAGR